MYKIAGFKVDTKRIKPGLTIVGKELTVQGNSLINYNCFINASAPVIVGERVSIAFGVKIMTVTHEIGGSDNRAGKNIYLPVEINEGSWIGAYSSILPGVKIGKGCVIAAGSVVTKDCSPNGLYAGVPARRIKDLK